MGGDRYDRTSGFKYYVLALLFLTGVLSYIDRKIIAVLLTAIKADLRLTDTQLGLLAGGFFAVSFFVAGIPLARLSDRGNRSRIIAGCLAVWSMATVMCGLASSYAQLAVARMVVGVGEAGSAPASFSLLADIFPQHQRARAFSIVSCGSAVGLAFGFYIAGALSELLTWRQVFLVVGAPGLGFAVLLWLTVPEPVRGGDGTATEPPHGLLRSLGALVGLASYRWLMVVLVAASTTAYAVLAWMPTFLMRVHGLSASEIGLKMGAAVALGLLLGNLSSGVLADRLGRRDERWLIWVAGVGVAACIPFGLMAFFWSNANGALLAAAFYFYFQGFWSPPLVTLAVALAGVRSRALAASTIPIMQAIGGGLGPFFVGVMNDHFQPTYGDMAVRYSLAAALGFCVVAALAALFAGGPLALELRASRA